MEITNIDMGVKIDGGAITINPSQFGLYGGTAKASGLFDMSVPGYRYDLSCNLTPTRSAPLQIH